MTLFETIKKSYQDAGIATIIGSAAEMPEHGQSAAVEDDAFNQPTILVLPMGGHLDQLLATVFSSDCEKIEEVIIIEDDVLAEVLYDRQRTIDAKRNPKEPHDGSDTDPEE